jgi:class 3 adenylate cyclase
LAREQRKLATILAADVVGYSRLMGWDKSGTLARVRRNCAEFLDPVLARSGGRLVKLTGDGAACGPLQAGTVGTPSKSRDCSRPRSRRQV